MIDNRGRSCLGLCHPRYDVKALIRSFELATVIRFGWLDCFFNPKDSRNAEAILRLPKQKFCRIHIINGPGINNSRTQKHEITYGETTQSLSQKILKGDRRFLDKYRARLAHLLRVVSVAPPGTLELAISPWLEHQPIKQNVFDILAGETLKVFPEAKIVDNPVTGPCFSQYIHEKHSNVARPNEVDIVDLDGTDLESIDMLAFGLKYKNCKAVLAWSLNENGFRKEEGWKPPQTRVNFPFGRIEPIYRYWASSSAVEASSSLSPIDLNGCKKQHQPNDGYKRDFVWKLGDGRNFAVCLFPREFKSPFKTVELRKSGKVIDRGKPRGKYSEDNTNRLIYDFSKHPATLPDNVVLFADGHCWVLEKPQYRID